MTLRPIKLLCLLAAAGFTMGAHAATVLDVTFDDGLLHGATDYTAVAGNVFTGPGQYSIVANPAGFQNGYSPVGDHTSGSGNMLFFDGSSTQNATVWSTSAATTVGTTYTFSFWAESGTNLRAPTMELSIDGVTVAGSLATTVANWSEYTYTFTAASALSTYAIFDASNSTEAGNDGAIDDIRLTSAVPEAQTAMLMLAGLGLVGFAARRRAAK